MYLSLALLVIFAFTYSLIAGRLEKTPISGAVVFIGFGVAMGPLGIGWFEFDLKADALRVLADLTLALVLFTDAAHADKGVLKRHAQIPRRMLLLGLPGAIALGALVAHWLFPFLPLYQCLILATMLAATDAALGKPVVTNPKVPARLREGLNMESGLNDGLCVPILLVFITLAKGGQGELETGELVLHYMVKEIGIGLTVGIAVGAIGFYLMRWSYRRGWMTEIWGQLPVILLALGAFSIAQSLHGSGYISAFCGGMVFGYLAKRHTRELLMRAEGEGETMQLLTWVVFGGAVVHRIEPDWAILAYVLLSLTAIRMLSVVLCLAGTKEPLHHKLFMGWFGPRGLASIVFAIMVINAELDHADHLANVVALTVAASALLHGLTANPWAKRIAQRQG